MSGFVEGTDRSQSSWYPAQPQADNAAIPSLLDDLVGAGQQRCRHRDAKRLGGLHIRKVGGCLALENAGGIEADEAKVSPSLLL